MNSSTDTPMQQPEILNHIQDTPMAWTAASIIESDGVFALDERCREELDSVAKFLVENPLPPVLVESDSFDLPNCAMAAAKIRNQLDHGVGFVIIERLPVESYDYDIIVKLYWLLMSMVGRPVAQKWNGEMIYDVLDTGKKNTAGSGVRSSKTNSGQLYHTDNSFNRPPHFVGLLCLRPAVEGGESGLISFDSIYKKLLEKHPHVLPRLYQPFYFDRQREHGPDEKLYSEEPVFTTKDNVLYARLSTGLIRQGYIVAEKEMDAQTVQALEALDDVMESVDLGKTFQFLPGQIQIVNNRRLGHRRTAFTDAPDPDKKRHLVRIWLRDDDRRFYQG